MPSAANTTPSFRLQRTTAVPPSIQTRRSFLSSARLGSNTVNPTSGFSLGRLGANANRGTRIALALGLLAVGFVEGVAFARYGPGLGGWGGKDKVEGK